jgi:hypothetical protein
MSSQEKDIKDKSFSELTVEDCKKLEIKILPGAFDGFDGTQEELDAIIAEFTELVRSGKFLEEAIPLDLADLEDIGIPTSTPRTLH